MKIGMTFDELKASSEHRDAVKRQAIMFYKSRNVFEGEPRKVRWHQCLLLVVDTWLALGPQADHVPTKTFYL